MEQIILQEDIAQLGKKGDLLDVKAGFFRNYLLPLGKAQIVTPALIKYLICLILLGAGFLPFDF